MTHARRKPYIECVSEVRERMLPLKRSELGILCSKIYAECLTKKMPFFEPKETIEVVEARMQ